MNWFDNYISDPIIAPPDTTAPVIVVVSPTPGVAPGAPGGFSSDWSVARVTPIVLTVTDLAPGVSVAFITALYAGAGDELVVYRGGAFRGSFAGLSSLLSIANGLQFTVLPVSGWPSSDVLNDVTFVVDAVDLAGNVAP